MTPSSPVQVHGHFGGTNCIHVQGEKASQAPLDACCLLVTCLAHSSILNMDAVRSSEMSVNIWRTTRRHITQNSNLRNYYSVSIFSFSFSSILFCWFFSSMHLSLHFIFNHLLVSQLLLSHVFPFPFSYHAVLILLLLLSVLWSLFFFNIRPLSLCYAFHLLSTFLPTFDDSLSTSVCIDFHPYRFRYGNRSLTFSDHNSCNTLDFLMTR
jgi:hypothetical protein